MFKNKGLFLFNLQSAIYILQSLVTLDHVQAGLTHVLATQQASSRDPVVQQIRQFLSLATQMSLEQAIQASQVDIFAIKRLGEIGLELKTTPLSSKFLKKLGL